jgi:wyosine [tRNA(Phe)-imidazoG37] synthetase (radical SAM superfamily)
MNSLAVCAVRRTVVSPRALFAEPRDFLGNRFVYAVISPRAKGLSLGVNMNPDGACNFDCVYCEVNRADLLLNSALDVEVMSLELEKTLDYVRSEKIREHPFFGRVPFPLLQLRHVTLSGDGEPTMCSQFCAAVETVVHVRARSQRFFKIVLITSGTGLDSADVQKGLRYFTSADEIWAKLDAGTQAYAEKVNHPQVSLERVRSNILELARIRPITIQSLFPSINGQDPPSEEIQAYVEQLLGLKRAGANITLVQIYSATRPTPHSECGHLSLKSLANIARIVREVTGINTEVS